jgi:multidrug efflux pump subunit AcrA (membrane-fusion protein)
MTRVVAILLGVLASGCHCDASPTGRSEPVREAVVRPGDIGDRIVLTGVLRPMAALDLVVPRTDQSPLVIRWLIDDGAVVKAGDRVFEFDNSSFTSKLQDDQADLRTAESKFKAFDDPMKLGELRFAVRTQKIALDQARLEAELPADLLAARSAKENQLKLTQAEADLREAERHLAAATAESALERRIDRIALDKTRHTVAAAEQAIEDLMVKTPRDGVVIVGDNSREGRKFRVGDSVYAGMTIASLPDATKPMEIRAELIDVDEGRVGLAMTGTCTADAFPDEPIACSVIALAPVARPKESRDSMRRTFEVVLSLAHDDPARLRPGMSFKVELQRRPLHGLVVPRAAVIRDDNIARLQLATGELRDVALGPCDAQVCAIASGVSPGDVVRFGAPR